jgi:glycosyltransferase involved in cell wall biosynthesis
MAMQGNPVQASVCIATFRRPGGLQRLLESLLTQKEPPAFEVVVVDNDREASAAGIADAFKDRLSLRYFVEPRRGLARVRNRAIAESHGRFIAFIDDDEVALPNWLAALERARSTTQASAVFGPVDVQLEPGIPPEIRDCSLFRTHAAEAYAPMKWQHTRTSNVYIDRTKLPSDASPFQESFDHTGGEDVDLFYRMAKLGATFAHAGPDATVTEIREKSRSDLRWLLRRSFRNGGNIAEFHWEGKTRMVMAADAVRNVKRAAAALVKAVQNRRADRHAYIAHLIEAGEATGKTFRFLGYRYQEYARRS